METIFWITVALVAIAITSIVLMVRQNRKMFKSEESEPIDFPGRYEESERPFIEYFN